LREWSTRFSWRIEPEWRRAVGLNGACSDLWEARGQPQGRPGGEGGWFGGSLLERAVLAGAGAGIGHPRRRGRTGGRRTQPRMDGQPGLPQLAEVDLLRRGVPVHLRVLLAGHDSGVPGLLLPQGLAIVAVLRGLPVLAWGGSLCGGRP